MLWAALRRLPRGGSVRVRVLAFAVLVALPMVVATIFLFALERRQAVARTEARLLELLTEANAQHEGLLLLGRRVLQVAAVDADIATGSPADCERALSALAATAPEVLNPTRTSAKGIIDCVPGRRPGSDVSANPIFIAAVASDSIVVGPYVRSSTHPEAVVPVNLRIAAPDGRVTGLLSIGVRMRWFDELARRADLPTGSVLTMVDGTGLVLARHPDGGFVGRAFPNAQFTRLIAAPDASGIVDGVGLDGITRRVAYLRLRSPPERPVGIAIAVPTRAISADANRALTLRLVLIAVALLLSWLVVSVLLRPLVLGDIEKLDAAADRIGGGDFTTRTGVVNAPAELQRLADTIDAMAARLGTREERQLQAQKLESVGRLAGGVAHDFNNMLTAVMGNVEEVRDALPEGSELQLRLDAALAAAMRSGELTRELLAFTRRDGVTVRPIALGPVLDDTARLMRRTLGPDVTVTVDCDDGLVVSADRAPLEQALVNLAINARDAMPGGGSLVLRARRAPASAVPLDAATGDWVRLDVQDSGSGMTPEVRQRVFEPFFTTKPMGKGSGLGLAMVYATITSFGGTASVDSSVGRGTTISLWFPMPGAAHDAATQAEEAPRSSAPALAAVRANGRILLVEDEVAVRGVSARWLRRAGYDVTEADDGLDGLRAVEAADAAPFDIIISDVMMPRMGGGEFGEAVRRRLPHVPLLFLSGFYSEERIGPLLAMPRTRLLTKPFALPALTDAVAEMLAER